MQDHLTLKLHLLPSQTVPIQQADPLVQGSVRLLWRQLSLVPPDLLPVLVRGQFERPLQKAFPVGSLDDCRCHLFLFPAQSAANWLIRHLQEIKETFTVKT